MSVSCPHLGQIQPVPPGAEVCEDCVRIGGTWVNLRQCLLCGHTACCNSSPNTHSMKHYESTDHALIRSVMPGQDWLWCYVDELTMGEVDGEIIPLQ
jgi:uncharacterized UBP type Zn finger protein